MPDSRYDRGSDRMDYAIKCRGRAVRYTAAETRFELIITAVRRLFRSSNIVHFIYFISRVSHNFRFEQMISIQHR